MRPRHVPDSDLGVFTEGVSPGRKLAKPQALSFSWALPGDGEAAPRCGLKFGPRSVKKAIVASRSRTTMPTFSNWMGMRCTADN